MILLLITVRQVTILRFKFFRSEKEKAMSPEIDDYLPGEGIMIDNERYP